MLKCLIFVFRFCTAGEDRKLRYFVSDGRDSSTVTTLEGHLSYINDCVIEPVSGLDVASVSGKQQQRNNTMSYRLLD